MSDRYQSRAHTARDAMGLQDACNSRGVLRSAWDMACFIGRDGGEPAIREAPEMVLIMSKLADMFGQPGPDMASFSKAWEACEALASTAQAPA